MQNVKRSLWHCDVIIMEPLSHPTLVRPAPAHQPQPTPSPMMTGVPVYANMAAQMAHAQSFGRTSGGLMPQMPFPFRSPFAAMMPGWVSCDCRCSAISSCISFKGVNITIFNGIFVIDCTGSCHFDKFRCSQWQKFRQNELLFYDIPPWQCRRRVDRWVWAISKVFRKYGFLRYPSTTLEVFQHSSSLPCPSKGAPFTNMDY